MCVKSLEHSYSSMVKAADRGGEHEVARRCAEPSWNRFVFQDTAYIYTQNYSVYSCLKLGDVHGEGSVCYITAVRDLCSQLPSLSYWFGQGGVLGDCWATDVRASWESLLILSCEFGFSGGCNWGWSPVGLMSLLLSWGQACLSLAKEQEVSWAGGDCCLCWQRENPVSCVSMKTK